MSFWYKHISWSHTWQHIKYRRLIKINNQIKHIYLTKTLNSKVTHTHTTSHRRTSPSKWQPTRNKCFMSSCFGPSEWVNLGVTNLRWSPFAKNKKRQTLITCRSIFRVGKPSCVRDGDIQYFEKSLVMGIIITFKEWVLEVWCVPKCRCHHMFVEANEQIWLQNLHCKRPEDGKQCGSTQLLASTIRQHYFRGFRLVP